MKQDYQELIKSELFDKEWIPQDMVLSTVARKRHGIARSGDKKKGAVLIALKAMLRRGVLRKAVDEDGNIFWGKRSPGEDAVVFWSKTTIPIDLEELTKLSVARKNIALLEEALKHLFSDIFEKTYGNEWERHINSTTYEKLSAQYRTAKKSDWKKGGSPEELLSVAGLKDFSYILADAENRGLFEGISPKRFILGAKLSELGDYRNRMQHNDPLTKEEYIFFNITVYLLLRDLK